MNNKVKIVIKINTVVHVIHPEKKLNLFGGQVDELRLVDFAILIRLFIRLFIRLLIYFLIFNYFFLLLVISK